MPKTAGPNMRLRSIPELNAPWYSPNRGQLEGEFPTCRRLPDLADEVEQRGHHDHRGLEQGTALA